MIGGRARLVLLLLLDLHLNDRGRRDRNNALFHVQRLPFELLGMLDKLPAVAIRHAQRQAPSLARQISQGPRLLRYVRFVRH